MFLNMCGELGKMFGGVWGGFGKVLEEFGAQNCPCAGALGEPWGSRNLGIPRVSLCGSVGALGELWGSRNLGILRFALCGSLGGALGRPKPWDPKVVPVREPRASPGNTFFNWMSGFLIARVMNKQGGRGGRHPPWVFT